MSSSVLVSILPDPSLGDSDLRQDLLYISGNVDVLVEDGDVMRVGQFTGALLLLPSIEVLADGISKMRSGQRTIEIVLVGDTPSLWLIERKVGAHSRLVASYGGVETQLMARHDFDVACENAAVEFFYWLCSRRPIATWGTSATQIVEVAARVWPRVTTTLT